MNGFTGSQSDCIAIRGGVTVGGAGEGGGERGERGSRRHSFADQREWVIHLEPAAAILARTAAEREPAL